MHHWPCSSVRLFLPATGAAPAPTGLAATATSCPRNVNITGGSFTLSQGWAPGSVLTYSCPPGSYPSPASRMCRSNGRWQTLGPTGSSSRAMKATCRREAPLGSWWGALAALDVYVGVACGEGITPTLWCGRNCQAAVAEGLRKLENVTYEAEAGGSQV